MTFEPSSRRLLGNLIATPALIAWVSICATGITVAHGQIPTIESSTSEAALIVERLLADYERDALIDDIPSSREFYEQRAHRLAWAGDEYAEENAAIALRAFAFASNDGLNRVDYIYGDGLTLAAIQPTDIELAERDLRLTDSFLRYMRDMRVGRVVPAALSSLNGIVPEPFDVVAALNEALMMGRLAQLITRLPPPHTQYARLKSALVRYRALEAQGGWPTLPAHSEIVLSDAEPRVAQLRARLVIEWPELFAHATDFDLEAAVREYQRRNGLEPDGRVGPNTLVMLNVSVSTRVEQIIANMERWRWMPRSFEPRYISVNVPDATLEVMVGEKVELTSRVIVGTGRTPTPQFRAEITGVTVNPPWNVPASIARNEMLPRLQSDPHYLADRNMVLVNGPVDDPHGIAMDWKAISPNSFPFQIRQDPGADNALGVLKLELPNRFSVYLHDTPARSLFARSERFFSHGCIRVQEIRPLSVYLLNNNSTHQSQDFAEAERSAVTVRLALDTAMPVYVLYWTALANRDKSFGFRRDVYLRDERLIAELKSGVSPQLALADDLGCPLPS